MRAMLGDGCCVPQDAQIADAVSKTMMKNRPCTAPIMASV
jgi:hypothetical protein